MSKLFAIVPAAGMSRRMGRPKLLLPLGGRTVIARLLEALDRPEILATCVVVRPDDDALREAAEAAGATVVIPDAPPPDMRDSVLHALAAVEIRHAPCDSDGWLLAPADHPVLNASVLDNLIRRWLDADAPVMTPTYEGRRGHPTFFRWSVASEAFEIPDDRGLNELVHAHADDVLEAPVACASILTDLDTPEDFDSIKAQFEGGE